MWYKVNEDLYELQLIDFEQPPYLLRGIEVEGKKRWTAWILTKKGEYTQWTPVLATDSYDPESCSFESPEEAQLELGL